jgi:hypothetical protein
MLFVTKKTLHALKMIGIAAVKMVGFPELLLLVGICIVSLTSFLALFFLVQYSYFGVNVIDFSTVIDFLGCPISTHFLQTLFCLISLVFAMLILVIFSYSVTYILISKGLKKKPCWKEFLSIFGMTFKELVRQAVVMTLGYLAWIFSSVYIPERLEDLQNMCDDSYLPDETKYYDPFAILLYPLLVIKPGEKLKNVRAESFAIMKKVFTNEGVCQYTFLHLGYFFLSATATIIYVLWKYQLIGLEQAFLIELLLFVIYVSVVRLIIITFAVSVYHYCVGKEFMLYSSEFIIKSYKEEIDIL